MSKETNICPLLSIADRERKEWTPCLEKGCAIYHRESGLCAFLASAYAQEQIVGANLSKIVDALCAVANRISKVK